MKLITKSILIITTLFFLGCGDNTDAPLTHLVTSIEINQSNANIRSTDTVTRLGAVVNFDDNTSADITDNVYWISSDYNVTSLLGGEIWGGKGNGGDANITIEYEYFNNTIPVHVIALDINSTFISSPDINTTGIHPLEAKGNFENGDTNITIVTNIFWTTTNDAILTTQDYITTVEMVNTGETNVTATIFYDSVNERNITKTYIIE